MSNPYDRLAKESDQAWSAFQTFRDLGADRSLPKVAERCTKSTSLMKRWSAKHTWKERAVAYDQEQDRIRQDAANQAVAKVSAEVAEKREITAQRVLEEEARIAFSRITDVVQWQNQEGIIDSDKLPDEVAATIESVEWGYDSESGQKYVKKVKFYNKQPALTKLGENQKLWGSKDDPAQSERSKFFMLFLEAGESGELEREMKRRGLLPTAPGEVIPDAPDDAIEVEAVREE